MATFTCAILCLIFISCAFVPSLATVYNVGDSSGWALSVDYDSWASSKTFSVGDNLKFSYPSGHTVDEVSANDYSTCTVGNAISSDNTGSTTITLNTAGQHYFICGVPGHCGGGMKLSIKVAEAASTTPTTTPAAPTGGSTTTTPPSTTTSPATPRTTITPPAGTTETLPSSSGTISPFAAVFLTGVAMTYSLVLS